MRKAIFLDRDGVINKTLVKNSLPFSPTTFDLLEIIPGIKESILRLKKLNFVCLVVTNQPDVSRGKIEKKTIIKMNNYLKDEIKLDDIFVCYHDDDDNCKCRKPKPGLLLDKIIHTQFVMNEQLLISRCSSFIPHNKMSTLFRLHNFKLLL